MDIGDKIVDYPIIKRHNCDWSKRYSLESGEGPALIGNITDVRKPDGDITIEHIAKACEQKDPIMKTRTCILETCLIKCPAGK